jgi:serine/threonine protein phosphatase 1
MMLRALGHPVDDNVDDGTALPHWYRNGGEVTHFALDRLGDSSQQEIFEYLKALPLNIDITVNDRRYKLVHGAPLETYEADPKYKNPIHYAVWKRLELPFDISEDYTMIFGHTPTQYYQSCSPMEILRMPKLIGIDCGSGFPEEGHGRLACLRLDDGKVFYSQENE